MTELAHMGGRPVESAVEVARQATAVLLSLPHSGITHSVLDEITAGLTREHIVIDTTTGEPSEMEGFGRRLGKCGVSYIDATVAGSSRQARAREVIVMAAGDQAAIDSCQAIFDAFAVRTFRVGPCGTGARMKLVVNLVLGLNRAVLAEGLAFAEACNLDATVALEIMKASPAYSRAMDVKGEKMLRSDYSVEARLRQHHKDVRLILAEAQKHAAELPLSRVHDELLELAESAGFADADNSAIREAFRRR
jgi:3-hydroxyisobutyrate dehydrogenase-like beta-hydroxyacid dehydrogenase